MHGKKMTYWPTNDEYSEEGMVRSSEVIGDVIMAI